MSRYRKSWTEVIEEVYLGEALKPIDKSVVDAFYYKKEKEGKVVSTDGDTLTEMGIGGQQIAKWVGRKIKITAPPNKDLTLCSIMVYCSGKN